MPKDQRHYTKLLLLDMLPAVGFCVNTVLPVLLLRLLRNYMIGADVLAQDDEGSAPIHQAAFAGKIECLEVSCL